MLETLKGSLNKWSAGFSEQAQGLFDSIYPINPYTKKRELPFDPHMVWSSHALPEEPKWPETVTYHKYQCKGSSHHYDDLSVNRYSRSWTTSQPTFHSMIQKVFDDITQSAKQVAFSAGDSRYQFDYTLNLTASESESPCAQSYSGQITFPQIYLKAYDKFALVKGYEFLSFEDKTAAIIAHEVAHHCLGHTRRIFLRHFLILTALGVLSLSLRYSPLALIFKESIKINFGFLLGELSIHYLFSKYHSRYREREADYLATEFLYSSGYDVRAAEFLHLIDKTLEKTPKTEGTWETFKQTLSSLMSTHPSPDERYQAAKKASEVYFQKHGHYRKPGFIQDPSQVVEETSVDAPHPCLQLFDKFAFCIWDLL